MGKKKSKGIVKKGLDDWVMTYGDMMSLLLTFFVLIVSFSSMQEAKFEEASKSLKDAFGVMTSPESVIAFNTPLVPNYAPADTDLEFLYEVRSVEKMILDQKMDKQINVEMVKEGVLFQLPAPLLFVSGGAELLAESDPLLERLGRMFRKFPGEVRIEGHTDDVPIASARFPSNWELSSARAVAVARNFQSRSIPPTRLSATGYGEYRPIADNTTLEGRATNRRVEILLAWRSRTPKRQKSLPLEQNKQVESPVKPVLNPAAPAPQKAQPEDKDITPILLLPVTGHLGAAVDIDRK